MVGALQDRAAALYGNWPYTGEESYAALWKQMCDRYGNEYITVQVHLQALFGMSPLRGASSEGLRGLAETGRSSFRQLGLILNKEQIGEYMLLHHLEGLLDSESRTMWALPTLSQFFDYLDCRAGTLTGVSTNSGI